LSLGQVAVSQKKIRAAAKLLNEKLEAKARLNAAKEAAKKKAETSDEKLLQVQSP
jgi:hypothetical protein